MTLDVLIVIPMGTMEKEVLKANWIMRIFGWIISSRLYIQLFERYVL